VDILTTAELASLLKVCAKTIERACLRGEIPGFKVGKLWRFERTTISQWISKSSTERIDRSSAAGVTSEVLTGLQSISNSR